VKRRPPQFDFGENWQEFSTNALTPNRVAQARSEFKDLIGPIDLTGLSFLDIGFGQGLSLLTAASFGANAVGCDINPKCAAVLNQNLRFFPELFVSPHAVVGSILDPCVVETLRQANLHKSYDVVHSWGVLHHTGEMQQAILNAASLVAAQGYFIIAIYNRHWSSRYWLAVKWTYVSCPRWAKRFLVAVLYPVIYAAKWMVTFRSPRQQQRGMDFFYNVVDWIGGFPYEYASIQQIRNAVEPLGFILKSVTPAEVPTGCNQFVFRRRS
jgi:2-polyprenyl-3-methyl-5-hydroxy-6-metoxy-1,4-benzoquinol methylase